MRWSVSPASPECGRKTKVSAGPVNKRDVENGKLITKAAGATPPIEARHVGKHVVHPENPSE